MTDALVHFLPVLTVITVVDNQKIPNVNNWPSAELQLYMSPLKSYDFLWIVFLHISEEKPRLSGLLFLQMKPHLEKMWNDLTSSSGYSNCFHF